MINLAGVEDCDKDIIEELMKAGIEPIKLDKTDHAEVKALYEGEMHGWRFHRAWYYWVVSCKDAFKDGLEMKYASPMHLLDGSTIRLSGHCGCPAPDDGFWMDKFDADGRPLVTQKEWDEVEEGAKTSDIYKDVFAKFQKEYTPVEDKVEYAKENGVTVASSYHIDSQEGLELFCWVLRKQAADRKAMAENVAKAKSREKRINNRVAVLDYFTIKKENPSRIFTCPKDESHGKMVVEKTFWNEIATDFSLKCPDCDAYHWGGGRNIDEVIGIYESR